MSYRFLIILFTLTICLSGFCIANPSDSTNTPTFDISISIDKKELQKIGDNLVRVPNAFLPYANTIINGTFKVAYDESPSYTISNFEMFIYNRRGALVYKTDDILSGWNGKYKNKECPKGGYVYIVRYAVNYLFDGTSVATSHEKKGSFLLCE
ncbi:gliding motility-associated C-terminal domain-containing protein [Bacteroidales bacterium OttesenSCG-928-C19]|nr:gliding motility-associated C-terminal domain-containing protein [Bacteroidales bacterium OttesenSCG-928-C19]